MRGSDPRQEPLFKDNDPDAIKRKHDAQESFCKNKGIPRFTPFLGVCWSCSRQIYTKISLEAAGKNHITGCPHCRTSFCD